MKSLLLAVSFSMFSILSFAQNSKPASDTTKTKSVKKSTTAKSVRKDTSSIKK